MLDKMKRLSFNSKDKLPPSHSSSGWEEHEIYIFSWIKDDVHYNTQLSALKYAIQNEVVLHL